MALIPDDLPAEAKGAAKVFDRKYLIQPTDEVPDPKRPGEPLTDRLPLMPTAQRITVNLDIRKIAEAVNDAVVAGNIQAVVDLWTKATIKVTKSSDFHVEVSLEP